MPSNGAISVDLSSVAWASASGRLVGAQLRHRLVAGALRAGAACGIRSSARSWLALLSTRLAFACSSCARAIAASSRTSGMPLRDLLALVEQDLGDRGRRSPAG